MKLFILTLFFALSLAPRIHAAGNINGARKFPSVRVEITDADVSADLVGPLTDALTDPVNRPHRLRLLLQVAGKINRTLVLTHGVRAYVLPRAPNGFFPLNGEELSPPGVQKTALNIPRRNALFPPRGTSDAEGRYRLHQSVRLASRLDPDGTATVHYDLAEHPGVLRDARPIAGGRGIALEVTDTHVFHSGETLALPIHTFGPGVQHRVYITVTILPPGK